MGVDYVAHVMYALILFIAWVRHMIFPPFTLYVIVRDAIEVRMELLGYLLTTPHLTWQV